MTGCSELTQSPSGPACEKGFGHSTLCLSGERARHVRGLPSIVTALQCSSEPLVLRPKLRLQPEVSKTEGLVSPPQLATPLFLGSLKC